MIKNKFFIRMIAFFFCIFLCLSHTCVVIFGEEEKEAPIFPSTQGANDVYLYHIESDTVITNKRSQDKIMPSSTVKIMAGLVALDILRTRMEEPVTITVEMLSEVQGYTVGLKTGDTLKIKDLLYALICGGGNDAANALAIVSCGSIATFVEKMNAQAVDWGCLETNYTNPTGIDDSNMRTSLHDVVIISKKAINDTLFVSMSSLTSYTCTIIDSTNIRIEKTFRNRNALISNHSAMGYQNRFVKGLNAGTTEGGGYCVSSYATNGKDSYLCIVMGGKETPQGMITSYTIANDLLYHVFENYTYTLIAKEGDAIGELTVQFALPTNGSEAVTTQCILANDVYAFVPSYINYKTDLTFKPYYYNDHLSAPVSSNLPIGGVDIFYGDKFIASGSLITKDSVKESALLLFINGMKGAILSRRSIIFILSLITMTAIYFIIIKLKSKKKFH